MTAEDGFLTGLWFVGQKHYDAALLDACEEAIAGRISQMLSGDIEAHPTDADACLFCPVLNCERRLSK